MELSLYPAIGGITVQLIAIAMVVVRKRALVSGKNDGCISGTTGTLEDGREREGENAGMFLLLCVAGAFHQPPVCSCPTTSISGLPRTRSFTRHRLRMHCLSFEHGLARVEQCWIVRMMADCGMLEYLQMLAV